ncbi:hypothetical protein HAX54_022771, partial [Datura stramonium]|nr:hypothetical protein [Datura stramonium]
MEAGHTWCRAMHPSTMYVAACHATTLLQGEARCGPCHRLPPIYIESQAYEEHIYRVESLRLTHFCGTLG